MVTAMDGHIVLDQKGVARIAGSRSRVIDIVLDQREWGLTPDQIHREYPHLSLAQIHAALAYYHDHRAELDAEIERRLRVVESMKAQVGQPPVVERSRRLRDATNDNDATPVV